MLASNRAMGDRKEQWVRKQVRITAPTTISPLRSTVAVICSRLSLFQKKGNYVENTKARHAIIPSIK